MLAERVIEWTKEWKQQGRLEGREEGRQEGEAAILRRLLVRRFGSLTPEVLTLLEQASPEQLERWSDRLLDAASLDDIFRAD